MSSQLLRHGFIARGGQIIDATLVPVPQQHIGRADKAIIKEKATPAAWRPAKRRQKDVDATWTKKHGKSTFGYKLSVDVDARYKIIRKIETSTASVHDSEHFERVFDPNNTNGDVLADKGYTSAEREAKLKRMGYRNRIRRKGQHKHPLSACQARRNQRIARTRARVEHVFGAIVQMGGKQIRTVGQARADFGLTMMAACYNLKRLVYLRKAGIVAF